MNGFETIIDQLRRERDARRAMVLRHPDIAVRLTQPPLDFARPDQWTGYVPPEVYDGHHNDSPRRAALADIVAAAEAADRTHDAADLEVF